jgi:ribosomal protein L32
LRDGKFQMPIHGRTINVICHHMGEGTISEATKHMPSFRRKENFRRNHMRGWKISYAIKWEDGKYHTPSHICRQMGRWNNIRYLHMEGWKISDAFTREAGKYQITERG